MKKKILIILSFVLPLFFYGDVLFGRSFALDCVPGPMGFNPAYGQYVQPGNKYCSAFADIGAYAWAHFPETMKVGKIILSGNLPLWNQNNGIGVPLLGNIESSALFLPNIIVGLIGTITAFDYFIVFRMMFASLGMYLFLQSIRAGKIVSLIGCLLIFLNGYVTNLPASVNVSVDMFLPWVAYLIHVSYENKSKLSFVILSIILSLSVIAGMPESTVFIIFFYAVYVLFIVVFKSEFKDRLKLFYGYIFSGITALLASCVVLLPFLEFVNNGVTLHQYGAIQAYSNDFRNIIFWILPRIFGQYVETNINYQKYFNFGFWNMQYTGSFFAMLTIVSYLLLLFGKSRLKKEKYWKDFIFIISLLTIFLIQYFGVIQIPIFTKLPGFSQTTFIKYGLALINFLVSVGVVLTLDVIEKHKLRWIVCLGYFLYFITLLSVLFYLKNNQVPILNLYTFKYISLAVFINTTVCIILVLNDKLAKWHINLSMINIFILFLVGFELYFYLPRYGDKQRRETFSMPPGYQILTELRNGRSFSPDYYLYPNQSSLYNINDIRYLEAIFPKNYYTYLKNFVDYDIDQSVMRFTGVKENDSMRPVEFVNNPFFNLLSVKYLFGKQGANTYDDLRRISDILPKKDETPTVRKDVFKINGVERGVLFQHPDSKLTLSMIRKGKYLFLYPALSQEVFNKPELGDGVFFKADIDVYGMTVFRQMVYLDPKNNIADQHWGQIILGPFPDSITNFNLSLETISGKSDTADWAGWGGFLWDIYDGSQKNQYTSIYDKEILVSNNLQFLDRIRAVSEKICVDSMNLIEEMKKEKGSISDLAFVQENKCSSTKYQVSEVKISDVRYGDSEVSFTYSSPNQSYLVLANNFYPGWKLVVDGKYLGSIDEVNMTFQGFELPPGKNLLIKVVYHPKSFYYGVILLFVAVASWIMFLFYAPINRKK